MPHSVRRPLLLLVALSLLTCTLGLGRGALTDADEAYYAEAGREMVESGNWLTPHFNYALRFEKPILYYWLVAVAYEVGGVGAATARLPSALAGVLLVLLTFACGYRWCRPQVGLLGGAIVATSYGYVTIARMALPDMPLALFVCTAIWAGLEACGRDAMTPPRSPQRLAWLMGCAAALALGLLVKGPVAVALAGLVLLPMLILEREGRVGDWLRVAPGQLALAGVAFLTIAAPWYIDMTRTHGVDYLWRFFVGENLERFATTRYNDHRSVFFYLPVIAGGLLPWTPLLIAALPRAVRALRSWRAWQPAHVRWTLWFALPLVFFSLSVGKQPRYILPILPPLALLLASALDEIITAGREHRALRIATAGTGVIFIVLGALIQHAGRVLLTGDGLDTALAGANLAAGAAIGTGLGLCAAARWARLRTLPALVAATSALLLVVLGSTVLSSSALEPVERVAAGVAMHRHADEPLGTHRALVRNLVFYTGVRTDDLIDTSQLLAFLGREQRVLCVLPTAVRDAIEAEHQLGLVTLAEIRYFNPAGVRAGTLLWPNPDKDVETLALIANR